MYYYILGCGIACLVLFGINSMDTVDVKPAEILGKVILWPVALMEAVVRYSSTTSRPRCKTSRSKPTKSNQAAALSKRKAQPPFCFALYGVVWYNNTRTFREGNCYDQ